MNDHRAVRPLTSAPGRQPRTATVVVWVLRHLIDHVASLGHDTTPLGRLPGLRGRNLEDPDARVPDAAASEAWQMAAEITGDEALGLHVAQSIPEGAVDLLEYAFRSSGTLQLALEQLARYGRVMSDRAAASVASEGDALVVLWDGQLVRQRVDFALAFVVRLAREATRAEIAPSEVQLAYLPPEDAGEYREYFGSTPVYGAPGNRLVFARDAATRPFVTADPALAGVLRRRLDKLLTQVPRADDSIASRVRRALIESLAQGQPTAAAVGRTLGLSERTLHRRLRDERTSFRRILDQVRGDLASAMLQQQAVGIAEIAFILGYSEPAAFHRSFRRWTGQTPLTFRRGSRAD
jgi:AraC-like DNA-binding protein